MSQFIEGIEPIYIEYLVHGPVQHKNCDDDATHYSFYISASKILDAAKIATNYFFGGVGVGESLRV